MTDRSESEIGETQKDFEKWFFSDTCKHHSYEHEWIVWQAATEKQIKKDATLCEEIADYEGDENMKHLANTIHNQER